MPSVKISMQAILLEMAVAKEFGDANYEKLDPLTVSMGHPDAFAALNPAAARWRATSPRRRSSIASSSSPATHQVLSSYDIIGPHSVSCISMTTKFYDEQSEDGRGAARRA